MSFSIKVNGEYFPNGVKVKHKSLNINHGAAGEISVMDFVLIDENLSGVPYTWDLLIGQKIELFENGILTFGGQLDEPRTRKINNHPKLNTKIYAVDWHYIVNKEYINNSYAKDLISNVLKKIIDTYLVPHGIWYTSDSIKTTTNYTSINCPYSKCSDIFKELASLINYQWKIGPDKKFYFNERTLDQGSEIRENVSNYLPGSFFYEKTRSEYFNKKVFKNVNALTSELTEKCTPTPDQDKSFFVSFQLNSKPTLYVTQDINNLLPTEIIDSRYVGISGLDTGLKYYWNKNSNIISQDESESISAGYILAAKYIGQYKIDVVKENETAIAERSRIEGGTGVYVSVTDGSYIESLIVAEEKAQAFLDKHSIMSGCIEFSSYTMNYNIGDVANVIFPSLQINSLLSGNAGYLLVSKKTQDNGGANLLKHYNFVSGEEVGSWIKFFQKWIDPAISFTIREDAIVSVPIISSENTGWAGQLQLKQFTALFPGNALYPSNVLYPGTLNKTTTYND